MKNNRDDTKRDNQKATVDSSVHKPKPLPFQVQKTWLPHMKASASGNLVHAPLHRAKHLLDRKAVLHPITVECDSCIDWLSESFYSILLKKTHRCPPHTQCIS
ncbi:hypothetical protein EVA_05817 [gut metagenome]|uniref:Uncharacterized protein n=1 Tax=gut metagenome TaxID=749906 RepID=J9GFE4_9ZZZZ